MNKLKSNFTNCLENFKKSLQRKTLVSEVPLSTSIEHNIPIYDGIMIDEKSSDNNFKDSLLSEWAKTFKDGAGIILIKRGISNFDVVNKATDIFSKIIENEKNNISGGGDHFAKSGENDRVWNALEKHCIYNPENFCNYYSSKSIHLACEAWLGPNYQITAQVNRVNPGGNAQKAHRDYHLGFMTTEQAIKYPSHVHSFSPYLTLQGAVAHCDMPIESGPTKLLPFSQTLPEGYLVFDRPEFQEYFEDNYIQLPLEKNDLIFFNPAIMHAAGQNISSDIYRMANLLQISSAFGRAMETVNRLRMSLSIYPFLLEKKLTSKLSEFEIENIISACSEGYSFPTNLDLDPPKNGMAPITQSQIMKNALNKQKTFVELNNDLLSLEAKQKS